MIQQYFPIFTKHNICSKLNKSLPHIEACLKYKVQYGSWSK